MNIYIRKNDNDLLKYLDEYQINRIQHIQEIIELNEGKEFCIEGKFARDIFLIYEGAVTIWEYADNGKKVDLFQYYEGDTIGENNFIGPTFRKIFIYAKSNSRIVRYPQSELKEIMRKDAEISARIHAAINDALTEKTLRITRVLYN